MPYHTSGKREMSRRGEGARPSDIQRDSKKKTPKMKRSALFKGMRKVKMAGISKRISRRKKGKVMPVSSGY